MSKFRNRSIRALPPDVFQVTGKLNKKVEIIKEDYFGENIYPRGIFSNSTISSGESLFFGCDLVNRDLSSSSSLSWSDFEYENGTSEVLEELQKIDLVFKGELPVPPEYDRDEIQQWKEYFPQLRIFDEEKNQRKLETPDLKLNSKITNKSTVIINTPPTLNKKRFDNDNNNNNKNIFTITHKPQDIIIENFLKISPIKHRQERRQSNKSLIHIKETFNEPEVADFISLPFLMDENTKRNISSSHSQITKPKVRKKLVLPPIEINSQFRSVSATPRKPVKSNYERGKQSNLKDISEYYHTIRKQSSRLFL